MPSCFRCSGSIPSKLINVGIVDTSKEASGWARSARWVVLLYQTAPVRFFAASTKP
jgi:hypothetical protein